MPDLSSSIHLDMYDNYRASRRLSARVVRALTAAKRELFSTPIYGLKWGDPESVPPLKYFRDKFALPYVNNQHTGLEIGPGGGRWTRYFLGFEKLYLVDYHVELLNEIKSSFNFPNMKFIHNSGVDFPDVPDASVDFLFSFGVFVHLERELIEGYLNNMRRIVKPGGNVVIQYSDMNKPMARANKGFSDNDPDRMRAMVVNNGFEIVEEDTTTLWHSSVVRFRL